MDKDNWDDFASKHALHTLYEAKKNGPEDLPMNEDNAKMGSYLEVKEKEQMDTLKTCQDETILMEAWDKLNEILLCELIMFNCRRCGEVSKMKFAEYKQSCKATKLRQYEEYENLTKTIRTIMKCFMSFP